MINEGIRHNRTKLSFTLKDDIDVKVELDYGQITITGNIYQMHNAWSDLTDNQRIELIKSLIWTAPDMHTFHSKVEKLINSSKFTETLD